MRYRFGTFRLDAAKKRLWQGDDVVALTPKAIETLIVLVSRAGEIVDKDQLFDVVWPGTFVEEATLAQNISTLRKALGDTSDSPRFIATVPRRGYRFIETVAIEPPDSPPAAATATVAPRPEWRPLVWVGVFAALFVAMSIAALWRWDSRSAAEPVAFAIAPPEGTRFSTSGGLMALSPDGRNIVFVASGHDAVDRLWLRSLDSLTPVSLPTSEGASQPFWSPDSRQVAFFAMGKLKKIAIPAGTAQIICALSPGAIPLAGSWSERGDILFSSVGGEIMRVAASGGVPATVIAKAPSDEAVLWPQFLPDQRHFLYVVKSIKPERSGVYSGDLESNETQRIVPALSYAVYDRSGHLLLVQGDTLVALPFDVAHRRVIGDAIPVVERVAFNASTGRGVFAASTNGVLAYRAVVDTQLTWFDRSGQRLGAVGAIGGYLQFAVSPDGRRIAASRLDPQTGTPDIWIIDSETGVERRLTFDPRWEAWPLWSRDGATIAFASNRSGNWDLYEKPADETGPDARVLQGASALAAESFADRLVLFRLSTSDVKTAFLSSPTGRPVLARDLPDTDEESGRLSPDGRWLAYVGFDSSQAVYVRAIQSPELRWQVSPPGATDPRWRADGRELFYLMPDLSLVAVDVEASASFRAGTPRRLFHTGAMAPSGLTGQAYDRTSDAQRFLLKMPASLSTINILLHWKSLAGRIR